MKKFKCDLKDSRSKKVSFCWLFLFFLSVSVLGSRFFVSSRLVSFGDSLNKLESEKRHLLKENEILANEMVELGSYKNIKQRAQSDLGLRYDPSSVAYLVTPKLASR